MNNTMNSNASNSPRDPFAEIERRHESEWTRLFLAEPELLEGDAASTGLQPPNFSGATETQNGGQDALRLRSGQAGAAEIIRCWDEIADVFTLAAPATQWIVEGILPRASVTLLAGEPGSYKTWLALALLRGVAGGGNFLGRKCAQTSVLYLDRENPLAVMRERLAVLGIESLEGSRIWGGWLGDAPPAIGDARLVEIARERHPLIIFDSLIRFHAAADENSATEMAVRDGRTARARERRRDRGGAAPQAQVRGMRSIADRATLPEEWTRRGPSRAIVTLACCAWNASRAATPRSFRSRCGRNYRGPQVDG